MSTSIFASRMELLQGRFHGRMDQRKESGVESDSLPDPRYKNGSHILKMKQGEKWETKNQRSLLAECPARRQGHTGEKLVLFVKDLASLERLRRWN